VAGKVRSTGKSSDLIRNQTHNLLACNIYSTNYATACPILNIDSILTIMSSAVVLMPLCIVTIEIKLTMVNILEIFLKCSFTQMHLEVMLYGSDHSFPVLFFKALAAAMIYEGCP
jgi:hypothetical protein